MINSIFYIFIDIVPARETMELTTVGSIGWPSVAITVRLWPSIVNSPGQTVQKELIKRKR